MKVKVANINANPYRDMEKYPIDQSKVDALVESIKDTDFWDNLLARPLGNEIDGVSGKDLSEALKGMDECDFPIELGYGHHRWYAVIESGIEEIDIPIKVIDDDVMLKIMANENKGDWGFGNMAVILETVRQVRATLNVQATEFEDYDDYIEKYSFFNTEKKWKAAQTLNKIGFRSIHEFLGETWKPNDIRHAMATLNAIDEGIFLQEQVIHMPSVSVMERFQKLAAEVRDQSAFPPYFQDYFIEEASLVICDETKGATVKIVGKAATAAKKENNPIDYLLKQKHKAFDLPKELFALIKDDDSDLTLESIMETEGLMEFEAMDEVLLKIGELIKRDEEKAARIAAGETEAEAEPEPDDVESAVAQAEGEVSDEMGELPEGEATLSELASTFVQSSSIYSTQVGRLQGTVGDMDAKTAERFGEAFTDVFTSMVKLGLEAYGLADLKVMIEKAEESM